MSQRLCQPFTKYHHTPTVRLFPHPVLFWTYLTRSLQFPSARDLRYTVSYTRPASLKPVKKLGGTFVLTTPGPSERGECVVQILKKVVAPDLKKKQTTCNTE